MTDPDGDGGGEDVQTDWGLQLDDATDESLDGKLRF